MKTYGDCTSWMDSVRAYRKSAPEGMCGVAKDKVPTLRDVDPAAITFLRDVYGAKEVSPFPRKAWDCKVDGAEDGAYYSLYIRQSMGHEKLLGDEYRFFYRKTNALPDSAPADTTTGLDQAGAPRAGDAGAGHGEAGAATGRRPFWPTKL